MSETTNTRTVRSTRLTAARRAGLFLVGTAGALTLTGAFAGTASAFTPPAPQGDLPIVQAPQQPQPPVGPMVIGLPEDPGPVVDGPDQLAQPLPTPDPDPAPVPQGPDQIAQPQGDGPGLPGPDDFSNGEDEPGVPGPDDFSNGEDEPGVPGPDDLTNGEDEPGLPGPDDLTNGDGGTVDPEPTPGDEVESEDAAEVESATASDGAASSLAFTGSELGGLTVGLVLLGAGGVAAAAAMASRRRHQDALEADA